MKHGLSKKLPTKGTGEITYALLRRWDLCNEIDLRALAGMEETIPSVDQEIQKKLEKKALFNKWLTKSDTGEKLDPETGAPL